MPSATILDLFGRVLATGRPMSVKMSKQAARDALLEFKERNPFRQPDLRIAIRDSDKGDGWARIIRQRLIWREG